MGQPLILPVRLRAMGANGIVGGQEYRSMSEGVRHDEAIERISRPPQLPCAMPNLADIALRFFDAMVLRKNVHDVDNRRTNPANFPKNFHFDYRDGRQKQLPATKTRRRRF
jgi:hypothetical protein